MKVKLQIICLSFQLLFSYLSFSNPLDSSIHSPAFLLEGMQCDLLLMVAENGAQTSCNARDEYIYTEARTQKKSANFFSKVLGGFTDLFLPVWGEYNEGGPESNKWHPLTTFDRGRFDSGIDRIRANVALGIDTKGRFYQDIYKQIYDNAVLSGSGPCSAPFCDLAARAKDAAFVYMVGIDKDGAGLTTTRESFYNLAVSIIKNWESLGNNLSYTGASDQAYRAKENIQLLQAYDYLELAKYTGGHGLQYGDYEPVREALFTTTYRLYSWANNTIPWTLEPNALTEQVANNITLVVAAAVGMGAIMLHDRGTYFWAIQRRPERWAHAANAYITNVMWTADEDERLSERSKNPSAGFAEGPHYFRFAFEALMPYFQSFRNFTGGDLKEYGQYYKCALCFSGEWVINYYADQDFINLYNWYINLKQPNDDAPALDDTWLNARFPGIAISGNQDHSIIENPSLQGLHDIYTLSEDYLCHAEYPQSRDEVLGDGVYENKNSGNVVVRLRHEKRDLKDKHYIHINAETGSALNGVEPSSFLGLFPWGHEHGDATSFIITAGEDVLALDPPLFGDKGASLFPGTNDNFKINQPEHHNVITIDGKGPAYDQNSYATTVEDNGNYKLVTVQTTYTGFWGDPVAIVKREIEIYDDSTRAPYYVINDDVKNKESSSIWAQFNLNGNGRSGHSFYVEPGHDNVVVWKHPCIKDADSADNWKLRATLTTQIQGQSASNIWGISDDHAHGNDQKFYVPAAESDAFNTGEGAITNMMSSNPGNGPKGVHTRATKQLSIGGFDEIAHFQVRLEPLGCLNDTAEIAQFIQSPNHTGQTVNVDGVNGYYNFHYSRSGASTGYDTVTNPFMISGCSAFMGTTGRGAFLNWAKDSVFKSGYCASYSSFRKASIRDGDTLHYAGTLYIGSSQSISAYYEIIGKFKYKGTVSAPSGGAVVEFRIPDLEQDIEMIATTIGGDPLTSVYDKNSTWNKIKITFPEGKTDFLIVPDNPCAVECFFPPTAVTIDTLFDFNTGTMEPLGHDLSTEDTIGWLRITNGSKMSICPNYIFHNKDSITLGTCKAGGGGGGGAPSGGGEPTLNTMSRTPMYGLGASRMSDKKRNMIIVNDQAGLVLDSGSQTHIGSYSTILIKEGGTLLVKKGAMLEVGDPCPQDRGELICEPGSYVCLEEGADTHFFEDIDSSNYLAKLDTFDRHIVYIAMPKNVSDGHGGVTSLPGATAGLNPDGGLGKFLSGGPFYSDACVPFCDWKVVNPPHGFNNREFGWCNVSYPVARFKSPDTVCIGIPITMDAGRTLNETGYRITVCKYDHVGDTCVSQIYDHDTDTYWIDKQYLFTPDEAGHYKIRLIIHNDCGEIDSTSKILYVPELPEVSFDLPDSACDGYGTVLADGSASVSHMTRTKYRWGVNAILPDSLPEQGHDIHYGGDWELDSTCVADSFDFPGFRWVGGITYAVSLTVKGSCGDSTLWDTIKIPVSAQILIGTARTYSSPMGPSAFQLHGIVAGASYFSWAPPTYLDNSTILDPTATPAAPITYVFSATNGVCTAYDTAVVRYNTLSNAGEDRTICTGSKTLLGTPGVDVALILGLLYTVNSTSFMTVYGTLATANPNFPKELGAYALLSSSNVPDYYCSGSFPLVVTEEQRNAILLTPAFAEFYAAFLDDPTDPDAFDIFKDNLQSSSPVSDIILGLSWNSCGAEDYITELFTDYANCSGTHSYTALDKKAAFALGILYELGASDFTTKYSSVVGSGHYPHYFGEYLRSTSAQTVLSSSTSSMFQNLYTELLSPSSGFNLYVLDPDFVDFYDSLTRSWNSTAAFALFHQCVLNSSGVRNFINVNIANYSSWSSGETTALDVFFDDYPTWLSGYACGNYKSVVWEEEQANSTWTQLSDWDNHYQIVEAPSTDTRYKVTVFDHLNNIVEYDFVAVAVDTILTASYYPHDQMDSTVYFTNTTMPTTDRTTYLWDFGDGSTGSTYMHPHHTFPRYDSAYIVCLTATNECGSSMICDTVHVDSLFLFAFKKGREVNNVVRKDDSKSGPSVSERNYLSVNRPNPFSEQTVIEYELTGGNHVAELHITTLLGQSVRKYQLHHNRGIIAIDGSQLQDGMYYYTLIVDGTVVSSKNMVVQK